MAVTPRRIIAAGVVAYAAVVAIALQASYEFVAAIAVAHVLVAGGVVLVLVAVRHERADIRIIVLVAFLLKMGASLVVYYVAFEVYGGVADVVGYHNAGARIAEAIRAGLPIGVADSLIGTQFIHLVTGTLYTVTGPTMLGGFFVFSFMGFCGLLLFYKAFRLAVPQGDQRRYALLVLLLPSLLFWPSGIGKDAWMTLTLGVAAYGIARLVAGKGRALSFLAVGLWGTAMVRPHVTLTLLIAFAVAMLAGRQIGGLPLPVVGRRLVPLAVVLVALGLVLAQTQRYFGVEELSTASVEATLETAAVNSSQGGSSFDPVASRSPLQVPLAVFSVLFRPLVFEARNLQALLASLEGTFLLFLALRSWPRLRQVPAAVRANPYVGMALGYTILFCIAFSNLGNFGIIARQRVQLLPFALVLLALPPAGRRARDERQALAPDAITPSLSRT